MTEASSACELVGHLLLKLRYKKALLESHQITELFPRNLVLTILTGIVGDSNMGQFLKSRRERRYYDIFSGMFNNLLARRTVKTSNFFTKEDIYRELQSLSVEEEECFKTLWKSRESAAGVVYVAFDAEQSAALFAKHGDDTVVTCARLVADQLAEKSGTLGLIAYYDSAAKGGLVQFRVRRAAAYKKFDVRSLLSRLSIANGGGHEGAIGFRIPPAEVGDFRAYVAGVLDGIRTGLPQE